MKHTILSLVFALALALLSYPWLISRFVRLGIGQKVQAYAPQEHKRKVGTPTAGGVLMCAVVLVAWFLFDRHQAGFLLLFALAGGAAAGFLDDVANVRGLMSLGLRPYQKIALQCAAGFLVGVGVFVLGDTRQYLPGFGMINFGWGIVILALIAVVATANAVNLTDGVDGLAASCSALALFGVMAIALRVSNYSVAVVSAAVLGSVLAFLLFNWHPARLFMGDTGALALGAVLTASMLELHLLWLLPLLGVVFLTETLSVIVNVTAITKFHRRVLRASPLHHHFEELGVNEEQLVLGFAAVSAVAMLLTVAVTRGLHLG